MCDMRLMRPLLWNLMGGELMAILWFKDTCRFVNNTLQKLGRKYSTISLQPFSSYLRAMAT